MEGFETPPKVEPRAELRQMASSMFEMYTAFRQAGFDAIESITLISNMMNHAPED